MTVQTVSYFGKQVTFPEIPEQVSFFKRLEAGKWEPGLFDFLNRFVDRETVFIDIGGWIGVTPFWAAQLAKRVITVEPDPVCQGIMAQMHRLNPGDVTVHCKAVANSSTLSLSSVTGLGSSRTSALTTEGEGVVAEGLTIADLMKEAGESPVCIKVDTEGYEYHLVDQFGLLDPRRVKAIQIAMHPKFYARSLKGPAFFRRIRTSIATWQVAWSLRGFKLANRKMLLRLVLTSLFNKKIRFGDLVFVSGR
jgi:FkbM family methyltransferase